MTIIKYTADWCGPCKMTKAVWEIFKSNHIETLFKEIDADIFKEDVKENNVLSLPTVIFRDRTGRELKRISGVFSEKQLEETYELATKEENSLYRI
jgi:thiol:disulfide interchange protein